MYLQFGDLFHKLYVTQTAFPIQDQSEYISK